MPEKIGHYTVVRELGRGGMGVVYLAHEESLNRHVAIKVLGEHLSSDETFLTRFVREARAAAGLSHPNVIPIYFIGEDQGRRYFAMEYVSGRSVESMIKAEGRIGNPRAAQLLLQAANGLAAAHDQGILHRDIKPANLMVDERGVLKIADFGVALPLEAHTRLTASGMMVGTPGYLSPEHCLGQEIDHRADIYALGVSYYQILTGQMPFTAESPLALLRKILQDEPPDISQLNPEVDAESRRILAKMIAKDPGARYQNCHELVTDVESYLASSGVKRITAGLDMKSGKAAAQNAATQMLQRDTTPPSQIPTFVPPARTGAGPTQVQSQSRPAAKPASAATAVDRPAGNVAATLVEKPGAAAPPQRRSRLIAIAAAAIVVILAGGGAAALMIFKSITGRAKTGAVTTQASMIPVRGTGAGASAAAGRRETLTQTPPSQQSIELSAPSTPNPIQNAEPAQPAPTTSPASVTPVREEPVPVREQEQPARERRVMASNPDRLPAQGDSEQPAPSRPRRAVAEDQAASSLSGVTVAVLGDPGLNGAIADVLLAEMEAAGLRASTVDDLPETENLAGEGSARRLISAARQSGFAVVVLARIEPTGQRQLNYLGRQDTAFGSRVTLTAFDVRTGKPAGQRQSVTLEYTQLTTTREAEKKIGPLAQKLAESLQNR